MFATSSLAILHALFSGRGAWVSSAVARPRQTQECALASVLASTTVLTRSRFLPKELEQLAKEQDKESEKQALLQEVENHRKQMLR